MDLSDLVNKVVDTASDIGSAVGSGISEASRFVADMVTQDAKDALTTARMVGTPGVPAGAYNALADSVLRVLRMDNVAEETDPNRKSTTEKFAAAGNTALNAASFVPGLGAGIKSAQQSLKSAKYLQGGSKLVSTGAGKKLRGIIDENKVNSYTAKFAESLMPDKVRTSAKNLIADQSLDYAKMLKGTGKKIKQLPAIEDTARLFGNGVKKLPPGMQSALKDMRVNAANLRKEGDFLNYIGKITLNKGVRLAGDAVRHGARSARKQVVSHGVNTWRKSATDKSRTQYEEYAAPTSAPLNRAAQKKKKTKKKKNTV